MTAKSMLMRSKDMRPRERAPACPLPTCYATAKLQKYPPTDLKLTNFNDTRMGVSREGQEATALWVFIHDTNKVDG